MLSHEEIIRYRDKKFIYIDPFNPDYLGANSYDVCLGNWFVNLLGWKNRKPVYSEFFYIPDGEYLSLTNNMVTLGMTKERIGARGFITPQIMTRSSIERMGIDVCKSAGLGDIGYYDQHWTIELTAHYPNKPTEPGVPTEYTEPAFLQVGSRIAQVIFHPNESGFVGDVEYAGQFVVDDWPLCMLPKAFRDDYVIEYTSGVISAVRKVEHGSKEED